MKKFLLSLCTAVLALSASAASYTVEFLVNTDINGPADGSSAIFATSALNKFLVAGSEEFVAGVQASANCYPGKMGLKVGKSAAAGSITLDLAEKAQVTPTKVTVIACNNKNSNTLAFNGKDYAIEGTEDNTIVVTEFTEKLTTLSFANATAGGQWIYVKSVTVEYDGDVTPVTSVAAPELKLVEGEYSFSVEMTCETEGAEIYYTTDGSEPTAESTKYTAPVEVWEATTFNAIAVKGEDVSKVTTFTANPPMILDGFNPLIGYEGSDVNIVVNGKMTAVYQNGQYTYVKDASGVYMLVYGSGQPKLNNGDTFTRLAGKFSYYKGQPQITTPEYGEITAGTAETVVNPMPIELTEVAANMVCWYVTVEGVEISDINGANATLTATVDGETVTAKLYNQFKLDLEAGVNYTVTGFIGIFNENVQLLPTAIEAGEEMKQVATPAIAPNGGELEEGALITITCETEGAAIHYTTDGTEPTAESALYTEPIKFTEAMTVKAIALAEGMLDSEVASASFTLHDPNAPEVGEVTFDFTDPEAFGFEVTEETKEFAVETAKSGVVTLTTTKGSNTPNRLWKTSESWEYRTYAKNTTEISVPDGYVLTSLVLDGKKDSKGTFVWSSGDFDLNTMTWTPTTAVNSVNFDVKGYFNSLKVTYKYDSGISAVETDADATVEYYNLQGIRIQGEPTPGLYIRRQGNATSKVIIR